MRTALCRTLAGRAALPDDGKRHAPMECWTGRAHHSGIIRWELDRSSQPSSGGSDGPAQTLRTLRAVWSWPTTQMARRIGPASARRGVQKRWIVDWVNRQVAVDRCTQAALRPVAMRCAGDTWRAPLPAGWALPVEGLVAGM